LFGKIDCFNARSDQEDLQRLVNLIGGMGLDPMVRHTGFLGLPTFYVYIPGMSEITNFFNNRFLEQLVRFERALPDFFSMTALDAQAREALAARIDRFQSAAPSRAFQAGAYLRHCPDSPLARVKGNELVTALRSNRFSFKPPPCFSCDRCDSPGCLYESMNGLWQGLKLNQARAHRCSIPDATGPEASLRPFERPKRVCNDANEHRVYLSESV
jgi:hypothetical protein